MIGLDRKAIQDIAVIDVSGDIDLGEAVRIKQMIGDLIEKERPRVILNLKAVDWINHLGIGVLRERLRLLQAMNGDLKLSGMSLYLMDVFRIVGMDRAFEFYPSLDEAIQSFDDDWDGSATCH